MKSDVICSCKSSEADDIVLITIREIDRGADELWKHIKKLQTIELVSIP